MTRVDEILAEAETMLPETHVATLAREVKRLRDERLSLRAIAEMVLDYVDAPPDRSCSCHISPPCNDCVENSGLRDLFDAVHSYNKAQATP